MRYATISPSRFSDMMAKGKGSKFGKTAESYAEDIVQLMIGYIPDEYISPAMQWGIDNEPLAVTAYEREKFVEVHGRKNRITHSELEYVSGEPDGLVGNDGIIEIKCPNGSNHFKNLRSGEQVSQYRWQIQGYLWLTDRKWCDFVSFHPLQRSEYQLSINRVVRDQDMIDELEARCVEFWHDLVLPIYEEMTNLK